jgi:aminoglycoside/choline kinase family phosphotransferase
MDPRILLIRDWLERDLGWAPTRMEPASADASFRRYFRVWNAAGATRIVMDAPPDREDIAPYVRVAGLLAGCDVHVPRIDAQDAARGLLLLEDLGTTHMLAALESGADAGALYAAALEALARIQLRGLAAARELPPYDRAALEREMALCPEWFCARHLRLEADAGDAELLATTFDFLVREALAQPVVFVHRDYHSRNLMVFPGDNPGILDFQDAVHGPLTYDLVSLLRDCYVAWPQSQVVAWALGFRAQARREGVDCGPDDAQFLRWFDLMGVQRHLKASGIFARLWHRDGKPGYLPDVPRTLGYIAAACGRHPDLAELGTLVSGRVLPAMITSLEARSA